MGARGPKADPTRAKNTIVSFRVNDAEADTVKRKANRARVKGSLSEQARALLVMPEQTK